jgi:chaperonin cofactor prefoldin
MTHNIKEKIAEIQQQLQQTIEQHNALVDQKSQLITTATELQGALKVLKEVDHDHTDQSTESNDT